MAQPDWSGSVQPYFSSSSGCSPCGAPRACLTLLLAPGQPIRIRVSDKALGGTTFGFTLTNGPYTPQNDSCATPMPVALSAFIDNLGATTGPEGQSESLCNFAGGTAIVQDLWYTWTSSATGLVPVSTCGGLTSSGSGEDSKIAVYLGARCPTASAIACSDDVQPGSCSTQNASASFVAVCSQTYTFQIGMAPGASVALLGAFGVGPDGGVSCSSTTNPVCLGDQPSGMCPCGNHGSLGNGCAGSVYSSGARLVGTGITNSTGANDTFVLTAQNVPGPCLFFQSSAFPFNSSALGDGRLCTARAIVRLSVVFPTAGVAQLPNAGAPTAVHVLGGVASGPRYYQAWYRSVPGVCGGGAFNLTQGIGVS